eukprot:Nitzschia sp. Nitz4//scaffold354_size22159//7331//12950//NITZ4_008577-RA/size22159-processed-gene-0.17-mRNA-1//-1//CDS//3329548932//162//frame0
MKLLDIDPTSTTTKQALEDFKGSEDGEDRSSHDGGSSDNYHLGPTKEPMKVLAAEESRRVFITRLLVLLVLLGVAVGVSLVAFFSAHHIEVESFEHGFESAAAKLAEGFVEGGRRRIAAIESFSAQLTSYAESSNSSWPYVALPDFERKAAYVRELSQVQTLTFLPIVTRENKDSWERFSIEEQDWFMEGLEVQGIPPEEWDQESIDFLAGQWGVSNGTEIPHEVFNIIGNGTGPVDEEGPYAIWWQFAPVLPTSSVVNYNALSHPTRSGPIRALMENPQLLVTEAWDYADSRDPRTVGKKIALNMFLQHGGSNLTEYEYGPVSDLYVPVFDSFEDNTFIVAELTAYLYWQVYFEDILSEDDKGIDVVLENTCNQSFTYQIHGHDAVYVGQGMRVDPAYSHMEVLTGYGPFKSNEDPDDAAEGECLYRLRIFPTESMEFHYVTNQPRRYAFTLAGMFLFTCSVFLLYDTLVERRQRLVLRSAQTSGAVVASLFPPEVRDRLYQGLDDEKKNNSSHMRKEFKNQQQEDLEQQNFMDASGRDMAIADLYPDCTVAFMDLVGFTQWASQREPWQVFKLLETLYKAFDKNAKRLDVFKVETIGDCYVAVTGLPNSTEKHALLMAEFVSECIRRADRVTEHLTSLLGPETRTLRVRTGLHSGPVIAGVLRGAKARFQLFGDTVNMAARMERVPEVTQPEIPGLIPPVVLRVSLLPVPNPIPAKVRPEVPRPSRNSSRLSNARSSSRRPSSASSSSGISHSSGDVSGVQSRPVEPIPENSSVHEESIYEESSTVGGSTSRDGGGDEDSFAKESFQSNSQSRSPSSRHSDNENGSNAFDSGENSDNQFGEPDPVVVETVYSSDGGSFEEVSIHEATYHEETYHEEVEAEVASAKSSSSASASAIPSTRYNSAALEYSFAKPSVADVQSGGSSQSGVPNINRDVDEAEQEPFMEDSQSGFDNPHPTSDRDVEERPVSRSVPNPMGLSSQSVSQRPSSSTMASKSPGISSKASSPQVSQPRSKQSGVNIPTNDPHNPTTNTAKTVEVIVKDPKCPSLAILGTMSDAGKSIMTAGLCRVLANDGLRPAPFKGQNMSNNASPALLPDAKRKQRLYKSFQKAVGGEFPESTDQNTTGYGEIGTAQSLQAEACRLIPRVEMNPVLLKSGGQNCNGEWLCSVLVLGKQVARETYGDLGKRTTDLRTMVLESHQALAEATNCDVVLMEGAGSCTELNLMERDIVNLPLVRALQCPWLLVANIDCGGVFAQIVGTKMCVSHRDWSLCAGIIVNKLRGDAKYFEPGPKMIEELVGKPVFVVPFVRDLNLPEEDGMGMDRRLTWESQGSHPVTTDNADDKKPVVVIVAYPHTAISDDICPLEGDPRFEVQWRRRRIPKPYPHTTSVVLPGSRLTQKDLKWLHDSGWAAFLRNHVAAGGNVLGICGGYQILGWTVDDPQGIEGVAGVKNGLGLLPIRTKIAPPEVKVVAPRSGKLYGSKIEVQGFELHCGQSEIVTELGDSLSNHIHPLVTFNDGKPEGA